jgi:hypothetical protein
MMKSLIRVTMAVDGTEDNQNDSRDHGERQQRRTHNQKHSKHQQGRQHNKEEHWSTLLSLLLNTQIIMASTRAQLGPNDLKSRPNGRKEAGPSVFLSWPLSRHNVTSAHDEWRPDVAEGATDDHKRTFAGR